MMLQSFEIAIELSRVTTPQRLPPSIVYSHFQQPLEYGHVTLMKLLNRLRRRLGPEFVLGLYKY